jgi:hypothetical protein
MSRRHNPAYLRGTYHKRPPDPPRVEVRCADCYRLTGRSPRIGTLYDDGRVYDERRDVGVYSSDFPRTAAGVDHWRETREAAENIRIVKSDGGDAVWYSCGRCEKRNDKRSPKIVPMRWFEEMFDQMAQVGEKKRAVRI